MFVFCFGLAQHSCLPFGVRPPILHGRFIHSIGIRPFLDKLEAQDEETAQEAPVADTEAENANTPAAIASKAEEAQEAPTEANTSDRESNGSTLPAQTGMVASPADNSALIL